MTQLKIDHLPKISEECIPFAWKHRLGGMQVGDTPVFSEEVITLFFFKCAIKSSTGASKDSVCLSGIESQIMFTHIALVITVGQQLILPQTLPTSPHLDIPRWPQPKRAESLR